MATPTLYDHEGRPVRLNDLKEEAVDPATAWFLHTAFRESVASTLTPRRLAQVLRDAAEGDHDAYLTLAEEIEERELHYRSVLGTRKLAISGAPLNVEPADDSPKAKEIADAVRRDILEDDAFQDLLFDLLDGLGKGFSVCEIRWDTHGKRWCPKSYTWRDPRMFRWDPSLTEVRLIDEHDLFVGADLTPFKFIVHKPKLKSGVPIRGGLARVAAVAYMFKSYTVRDWHTFMDVFGMPLRLGRYGPDSTAEERSKLRRAVMNIAADAAGIVPKSMDIEFIDVKGSAGGDSLFQGAAEWWDKQVSKVVLGQTMTSEDGASLAQAKVHNDVRLDLAQADARQLCASINRQLVHAYVDLNFGVQERYPAIAIQIEAPEDLKSLSETIGTLVDKGAKIPQWWVREKFGLPEPGPEDELLSARAAPAPAAPPPSAPAGAPSEASPPASAELEALNRRIAGLELALNRQSRTTDQIDRWAAEATRDWEPQLEGNVERVMGLAEGSSSYESFLARLGEEDLEVDELTRRMAIALYEARALGDATDRIR